MTTESLEPLIPAILDGDRRALARAISLVEQGVALDLPTGDSPLIRQGGTKIVGITGAPGSGKSTLLAGVVPRLHDAGDRVAVLAADPSSPVGGGALLGDRLRFASETPSGVFIRSLASRRLLGGLTPVISDVVVLLEIAGFDWIFVETVGVGQSEIDVSELASLTVALVSPDGGDWVQAQKSGLLEVADMLCVSKKDRHPSEAEAMRQMLLHADQLKRGQRDGRPILVMSLTDPSDLDDAHATLRRILETRTDSADGVYAARRIDTELRLSLQNWFNETIAEVTRLQEWSELVEEVLSGRTSTSKAKRIAERQFIGSLVAQSRDAGSGFGDSDS